MSGGSFNYLWCKEADTIINSVEDIENMINALYTLNAPSNVIVDSHIILGMIKGYREYTTDLLKNVREYWRLVELKESGDIGEIDWEKVNKC